MLLCTAVHIETIVFCDLFTYAFNSSCPCKLVRIWQRFRLQCLKRLFFCMETRNPFWSSETNVVGRHWSLLLLLATGSELTFSFSKSSPPFWIALKIWTLVPGVCAWICGANSSDCLSGANEEECEELFAVCSIALVTLKCFLWSS